MKICELPSKASEVGTTCSGSSSFECQCLLNPLWLIMRSGIFEFLHSFVGTKGSLSLRVILIVTLVVEAPVFEGINDLLDSPFAESRVRDGFTFAPRLALSSKG
jgi:hypothetical protein